MEHKVANFLPVDSQDFLKLVDVIILIGTTKQHSKSISDVPTGLFSQLIVYFVTFFLLQGRLPPVHQNILHSFILIMSLHSLEARTHRA